MMRSRREYRIDEHAYLVQAVGGRWMVLVDGLQWAPPGALRDASGAGDATYPSRRAAEAVYFANEQLYPKVQ